MFSGNTALFSNKLHIWITAIIIMNGVINLDETNGQSLRVYSTRLCISISNTLKARHKSCFLRPDTGPCRADIIQWYYDAKQSRCYRFFWGGCQGNGNKFENREECVNHCMLNDSSFLQKRPDFCSLTFDYGTCFGHYERWYWDNLYKTCKRRIYSGCGGNQNNFETLAECTANCIIIPNNTLGASHKFTTCVPLNLPELQKKRKKRDLSYFATPSYRAKRAITNRHKKGKNKKVPSVSKKL